MLSLYLPLALTIGRELSVCAERTRETAASEEFMNESPWAKSVRYCTFMCFALTGDTLAREMSFALSPSGCVYLSLASRLLDRCAHTQHQSRREVKMFFRREPFVELHKKSNEKERDIKRLQMWQTNLIDLMSTRLRIFYLFFYKRGRWLNWSNKCGIKTTSACIDHAHYYQRP